MSPIDKVLLNVVVYAVILTVFFSTVRSKAMVRRFAFYYWGRYSIVFGLFLFALPLIACFIAQPILYGLLVLENADSGSTASKFALVTWASLLTALMVVTTYRVMRVNAEARFEASRNPKDETAATASLAAHAHEPSAAAGSPTYRVRHKPGLWVALWRDWSRGILVVVLGLWIPGWCLWATAQEYRDGSVALSQDVVAEKPGDNSEADIVWQALEGISIGGAAVIVTLLLMGRAQIALFSTKVTRLHLLPWEAESRSDPGIASHVTAWLLSRFGPGYVFSEADRDLAKWKAKVGDLRPGHAQSMLLVGAMLCFYVGLYCVTSRQNIPSHDSPVSAMLLLLMMTTLLGFVVTGLAFFLDYYHIPTLLTIPAILVGSYWLNGTNHNFDLAPSPDADAISNKAIFFKTAPPPATAVEGKQAQPIDAELLDVKDALSGWKFPAGPGDSRETLVCRRRGRGHSSGRLDRAGVDRSRRGIRGLRRVDRVGQRSVRRECGPVVLFEFAGRP